VFSIIISITCQALSNINWGIELIVIVVFRSIFMQIGYRVRTGSIAEPRPLGPGPLFQR
jgi:hypothetical protein